MRLILNNGKQVEATVEVFNTTIRFRFTNHGIEWLVSKVYSTSTCYEVFEAARMYEEVGPTYFASLMKNGWDFRAVSAEPCMA